MPGGAAAPGTVEMRAGVGWQYALADLSLILFLVTAAALARQPVRATPRPAAPAAVQGVMLADPVAVWRAGPGAPTLEQWLAGQALDPRQRLTIVARYSGARAEEAFARAQEAMGGVKHLPAATRMVVEPAAADDLTATLTWDGG